MPLRYPDGSGGHVPYLGVGSVCRKYLGYGTEPEARERLQREYYALTITCNLLQVQFVTDPANEIVHCLPELSPDLLP